MRGLERDPVRRVINVPLNPARSRHSRLAAVSGSRRPRRERAGSGQIPKLIVRVRFSSPAPSTKAQVSATTLVGLSCAASHSANFRAINGSLACPDHRVCRPSRGAWTARIKVSQAGVLGETLRLASIGEGAIRDGPVQARRLTPCPGRGNRGSDPVARDISPARYSRPTAPSRSRKPPS